MPKEEELFWDCFATEIRSSGNELLLDAAAADDWSEPEEGDDDDFLFETMEKYDFGVAAVVAFEIRMDPSPNGWTNGLPW
jgi:hypothetical protein